MVTRRSSVDPMHKAESLVRDGSLGSRNKSFVNVNAKSGLLLLLLLLLLAAMFTCIELITKNAKMQKCKQKGKITKSQNHNGKDEKSSSRGEPSARKCTRRSGMLSTRTRACSKTCFKNVSARRGAPCACLSAARQRVPHTHAAEGVANTNASFMPPHFTNADTMAIARPAYDSLKTLVIQAHERGVHGTASGRAYKITSYLPPVSVRVAPDHSWVTRSIEYNSSSNALSNVVAAPCVAVAASVSISNTAARHPSTRTASSARCVVSFAQKPCAYTSTVNPLSRRGSTRCFRMPSCVCLIDLCKHPQKHTAACGLGLVIVVILRDLFVDDT